MRDVRAVWITWERQPRNRGVANALGAELFEVDVRAPRFRRYVLALRETVRILRRTRPQVVIVQNPSLILTCFAVMWGRVRGVPVVVDAHNVGVIPEGDRPTPIALVAAIARNASMTIVSNPSLAARIRQYGGRSFVLPDAIPDLPAGRPQKQLSGSIRVLFICTYQHDEPYEAVIKAARQLDDGVTIYVTGNPKEKAESLRKIAPPNVIFTGYLPEEDYVGLLRQVDVVVDLTLLDNCLVCGAYEAVAAGKPMVLSDWPESNAYFSRGTVPTDNTENGIAASIRQAVTERRRLTDEVNSLREELIQDWSNRRESLEQELRALVRRSQKNDGLATPPTK